MEFVDGVGEEDLLTDAALPYLAQALAEAPAGPDPEA